MTASANTRYHGLDLLRACALLFGFVLHAPLVVMVPSVFQEVLPAAPPPPEPERWISVLVAWIHLWRMPVFFLLSGFFAEMVIARKGWRSFAKDRGIRIFGGLVVFHLMFVLALDRPLGAIDHLWFLWFLAQFAAAAVLWAIAGLPRPPALGRTGFLGVLILIVLLAGLRDQSRIWHQIPDFIWEWTPRGLVYYFAFFVLGQSLFRGRSLMTTLARPPVWGACLLIAHAGYLALLIGEGLGPEARMVASGTATWGMCFGLIGAAQCIFDRPSRIVRWLVEGAYPIYVFHLYPVLFISALLISRGVPQGLTLILASLGAFGVSVAMWYILVRYTPLNWLTQGYANSWFKWPWATNGSPSRNALDGPEKRKAARNIS